MLNHDWASQSGRPDLNLVLLDWHFREEVSRSSTPIGSIRSILLDEQH
jgi:hypothetical protein